ncbi:MAG: hypothetical protein QXR19_16995 [Candidatus Jordarchaeaceae archaeon]
MERFSYLPVKPVVEPLLPHEEHHIGSIGHVGVGRGTPALRV